MARGWGRNEEDLGAEKEQAVEEKGAASGIRRPDAEATASGGWRYTLAPWDARFLVRSVVAYGPAGPRGAGRIGQSLVS